MNAEWHWMVSYFSMLPPSWPTSTRDNCIRIYIYIYYNIYIYIHGEVVWGMRLIRRPWKGCRFWDVPFTIPWKGCKFQKWGFPKWGYRIWNFRFFNVLHKEEAYVAYVVLSYYRQGGWGGMLTFVSNASITLRKRHMLDMLSYDRRGGGGGMLTFVSSASITLRKRHMLDMLSYDREGGWGGGWGC